MKVFISWSGDISLRFAQKFAEWLESVIQATKPFVSADDIRKGQRWFQEISKQLDETNFGILCVTPGNTEAAWLLFEAGALSKKIEHSHVCPLLIGVQNTDLRPPLSMFQTTDATKPEDIRRLLATINTMLGEHALKEAAFNRVFEKNFEDLKNIINHTLNEIAQEQRRHGAPEKRSRDDMTAELLGMVRGMSQQLEEIRASTGIPIPNLHTSVEYNPSLYDVMSGLAYPDNPFGQSTAYRLTQALKNYAPAAAMAQRKPRSAAETIVDALKREATSDKPEEPPKGNNEKK